MEYMSIGQYNRWLNEHDKEIERTLETVDEETKFAIIRIIQDISWALGYIDAICANAGKFRLMIPWIRSRYFNKLNELYCMIEASEKALLSYFEKAG